MRLVVAKRPREGSDEAGARPLLRMLDLGHRFHGTSWLFRGLSHTFRPGEITAIVGPSGTGKSTLMQLLSGGILPAEGQVMRAGRISVVHQQPHGSPFRTVRDHIALPMLAKGALRVDTTERVESIAHRFGLADLLSSEFRFLSGGEAQRLMLALAVAQQREVILADEPTASLDSQNAATVAGVLRSLCSDRSIVVVATHDERVRAVCETTIDLGEATLRDPVGHLR